MLEAFSGEEAVEIPEIYGELLELHKAGQLYSRDDYAQFADRMVSSPLKAMCLHVSHDCNLQVPLLLCRTRFLRRSEQDHEP